MRFCIQPEISCSRFFAEACFDRESLAVYKKTNDAFALQETELGSFVRKRMHNARFIDVPCGLHAVRDQSRDWSLPALLSVFGIDEYWEVDASADVLSDRLSAPVDIIKSGEHYELMSGVGEIGIRNENGLNILTIQDDVLGFLSKLSSAPQEKPVVFYLSGLQPDENFLQTPRAEETIIVPYLLALYDELERISGPSDTVILNASDMLVTGIDEEKYPQIHPTIALAKRGFSLTRRCPYDKVHVFIKV
jgi:hypothetical protein